MDKGAVFSPDRAYRYKLWRIWDSSKPLAMFVGLNPSTADEENNDPTVAKCQRYARGWGYGGLVMTNLFAFRSTDKSVLEEVDDPIGPENDRYLAELAKSAGIVVAAWGNDGNYLGRSNAVSSLLPMLHYLRLNKTGEPAHPLYLSGALKPTPMGKKHA